MSTRSHQKLVHIVDHVYRKWDSVLANWTYMRNLGQSKQLTTALTPSYAAHVHNAIQNALIYDTLREIGALILDKGDDATSLHHAMKLVKSAGVLSCIRAQYEEVPPPPRSLNPLEPEVQAEVNAMLVKSELERNKQEFEKLRQRLNEVESPVFDSDTAKKIRKSRNKAVAHYDVQTAGEDWKTMTIGDAGLKYGDIEEYLTACTNAVQATALFVRRTSIDYADYREIFEKNVSEYIDAIVRGRKQQKDELEARRQF